MVDSGALSGRRSFSHLALDSFFCNIQSPPIKRVPLIRCYVCMYVCIYVCNFKNVFESSFNAYIHVCAVCKYCMYVYISLDVYASVCMYVCMYGLTSLGY